MRDKIKGRRLNWAEMRATRFSRSLWATLGRMYWSTWNQKYGQKHKNGENLCRDSLRLRHSPRKHFSIKFDPVRRKI